MKHYNSVGIGFGPANIALAIAINELPNTTNSRDYIFFDSREEPSWHPGLLFDVSTMQISFLKDLVTMVNPTSEFTFLNYLKDKGRIHEFINLRTFYPRRTEFDDYLRWASSKLERYSKFNHKIINIDLKDKLNVQKSSLIITVQNNISGIKKEIVTNNIIVADGGFPKWPINLEKNLSNRIFHSSDTLGRLEKYAQNREKSYVFHVIGSGQSSADIIDYLGDHYTNSQIILTHRSFSMRPEDDSHFVNEIFMPDAVDMFQDMPQDIRDRIIKDYWHVTHNGVTIDLIPKLYERIYYDKVNEGNRYHFNKFSEIIDGREIDNKTFSKIRCIHTGDIREIESDFTILATGYERPCSHPLLQNLDDFLQKIADETAYEIDENYRVRTSLPTKFNIYMQGYGERTHGFSETLLSLMPERAVRIASALVYSNGGIG